MVDEGGSIKLRNLIIRDAYKERWLKEKSLEKEKERKNKLEILNRSAIRFSSSPFAVNAIGLEEINEHNRNFDRKFHKNKKNTKPKRKISETRDQKFLAKLRNEVKTIENSKIHSDERKLIAALNEKQKLSNTYEFNSKSKQRSRESEGFPILSRGGQSNIPKTGNHSNYSEKLL